MEDKYHINSKGEVAICRARKGKCPFTKALHFESYEKAEKALYKYHSLIYGSLPNLQFENQFYKIPKDEEKKIVEERKKYLKSNKSTFINRIRNVKRVPFFEEQARWTRHYRVDRRERRRRLVNYFGEGEPVSYYYLEQLEDNSEKKEWKERVFEINNNGRVNVYSPNGEVIITTFLSSDRRIESVMTEAGDLPNEKWLQHVKSNYKDDKRIVELEQKIIEEMRSKKETQRAIQRRLENERFNEYDYNFK